MLLYGSNVCALFFRLGDYESLFRRDGDAALEEALDGDFLAVGKRPERVGDVLGFQDIAGPVDFTQLLDDPACRVDLVFFSVDEDLVATRGDLDREGVFDDLQGLVYATPQERVLPLLIELELYGFRRYISLSY